jgi:TPR repeat protein|uniref:Uncharacterized protein n=1 Tax=viral metagenome TaxID=1070528 RepID=A0A6C0IL11_9ZZZZ
MDFTNINEIDVCYKVTISNEEKFYIDDIDYTHCENQILKLFNDDIQDDHNDDPDITYWNGIYNWKVTKKYDLAIEQLLNCIELSELFLASTKSLNHDQIDSTIENNIFIRNGNIHCFIADIYYIQNNKKDTLIHLKYGCETNNDMAFYKLGKYYTYIDNCKSMNYHNLAIQYGNRISVLCMALYYRKHKNYQLEKDYLLLAKNNGAAMGRLGTLYMGHFVDYENTIKYYNMSIDKGHVPSLHNLGIYYKHIEKNYEKMEYYLKQSCEKLFVQSMILLGNYYKENNCIDDAIKYYTMAIINGDISSINILGSLYYEKRDYANVIKYYCMGIDYGCYKSMNKLGVYYRDVEYNYKKAEKYFKMCYDKNHKKGIVNLLFIKFTRMFVCSFNKT